MNGSVDDFCRAKVTVQVSVGSAVQDTGPAEPGGQLWEGGDRLLFAASGLRRLSLFQ